MTLKQGGNLNTDSEAILSNGIPLNSTTSTVISVDNPTRTFIRIDNNFSDKACWIKFQPAATDNDKKGIFLNEKEKGQTVFTMQSSTLYTGEISAIADSGSPIVYVTEF